MNILATIFSALFVLIVVLYFPVIKNVMLKMMEAAHLFADEYNSVYREDETPESPIEEESKKN